MLQYSSDHLQLPLITMNRARQNAHKPDRIRLVSDKGERFLSTQQKDA
jgi:hypothetical protein